MMQKINVEPLQKLDYRTMENIKMLRTNISFLDPTIKVINITSAAGREGKSMISFWLSHALAESGKKVVLVDANLRKTERINIFEIFNDYENRNEYSEQKGKPQEKKQTDHVQVNQQGNYLTGKTLKKFLMGKTSKEEILFESNIPNMYFILSGHAPNNPSELLSEPSYGNLISYLRENFDYVIIDTPAIGEVTDGVITAKHSDGSLMVIEPGIVHYELAQRVKEQLENSGTKVLGVVLNKVY